MNNPSMEPLEAILRLCAQATPDPWYPTIYAQAAGVSRDSLDPDLDRLRMSGLIRLTDWVQGRGQGYTLTPLGSQVLDDPRQIARLRAGQLPAAADEPVRAFEPSMPRPMSWERGEVVRAAFLDPATPVVTFSLLFLNIAVFLAGIALASSQHVPLGDFIGGNGKGGAVAAIQRQTGFLSGEDVYIRGQWWRLLTCCFGHVGFIHLAVNMYSLYVVGPLLERLWGSRWFLVLYLVSGLGGSCGMLLENPLLGGAGASGALWGIMASFGTWIFLNREALPPTLLASWRRSLLITFLLNVFITFGIAHISKGGHFGGGIVGLIAAVPADYLRFGRGWQRLAAWPGLIAVPLTCVGLAWGGFNYTGDLIVLNHVYAESIHVYNNEARALLNQPVLLRDPGKLVTAIEDLEKHQKQLRTVLNRFNPDRPFWNPPRRLGREVAADAGENLQVMDVGLAKLKEGQIFTR
jgi:membrane associated rhomboid family serine protease